MRFLWTILLLIILLIEVKGVLVSVADGQEYCSCTSCCNCGYVIIPTTTSRIENSAFKGCFGFRSKSPKLSAVIVTTSVTYIGQNAFQCNTADPLNLTLPTSLVYIDNYAVQGCQLRNILVIPTSVTYIGQYAFSGTRFSTARFLNLPTSLASISSGSFISSSTIPIIPTSVTYIGSYAFSSNGVLKTLSLPTSLVSIDSYAFLCCGSLHTVILPTSLTYIGMGSFLAYKYNVCKPKSSLSNLTFPTSLVYIGASVFSYTPLQTAIIPTSVTYIGDYSFSPTLLRNLTLSTSVAYIGRYAFGSCPALHFVMMPTSITFIGVAAFNRDTGLNSLILPSSLLCINANSFQDCSSLQIISIPTSVTYIGVQAFSGGTSFKTLTLPTSLLYIAPYAFQGCGSLQGVVIPTSVTYLGEVAFGSNTALKALTLPTSLLCIYLQTFKSCTSLQTIIIPASVTFVGYQAFSFIAALKNLTLGTSVAYIDDFAFYIEPYKCVLDFVIIPTSVSHLSPSAFLDNTKLIYSTNAPSQLPTTYTVIRQPSYDTIITAPPSPSCAVTNAPSYQPSYTPAATPTIKPSCAPPRTQMLRPSFASSCAPSAILTASPSVAVESTAVPVTVSYSPSIAPVATNPPTGVETNTPSSVIAAYSPAPSCNSSCMPSKLPSTTTPSSAIPVVVLLTTSPPTGAPAIAGFKTNAATSTPSTEVANNQSSSPTSMQPTMTPSLDSVRNGSSLPTEFPTTGSLQTSEPPSAFSLYTPFAEVSSPQNSSSPISKQPISVSSSASPSTTTDGVVRHGSSLVLPTVDTLTNAPVSTPSDSPDLVTTKTSTSFPSAAPSVVLNNTDSSMHTGAPTRSPTLISPAPSCVPVQVLSRSSTGLPTTDSYETLQSSTIPTRASIAMPYTALPSSASPTRTRVPNTVMPTTAPSYSPNRSPSSIPSLLNPPTILSSSMGPSSESLSPFPTLSTNTTSFFFASQTIIGVSLMQYTSNINYTAALLSSIITAFVAPINISLEEIQNLAVTDGSSLHFTHTKLPSTSTSTSTSSASIVVFYKILTNSKYPSTAYATQLTNFVNSGSFITQLHYYAVRFRTPGFVDAKSSSITIGDTPKFFTPAHSTSSSLSSRGTVGVIIVVVAAILLCFLAGCYCVVLVRRNKIVDRFSKGFATLETSFSPISGTDGGDERFLRTPKSGAPSTSGVGEGEEGCLILQSNDDDDYL